MHQIQMGGLYSQTLIYSDITLGYVVQENYSGSAGQVVVSGLYLDNLSQLSHIPSSSEHLSLFNVQDPSWNIYNFPNRIYVCPHGKGLAPSLFSPCLLVC